MSSILQVEGGHPLRGEITVRGAKNFVPKAMVASLLADTPSELYNVPLIRDTDVVSDLLSLHGVQIDFDQDRGTLRMDPSNVKIASRSDIDTLAGASRIPILFCGPLLHQLGEAFIPELGGCAIGGRPIDFHLETLRKFGAIVDKQPDGVHIKRPATGLHGAIIELPFPSVGATEQTLLTAVRNEGITTLKGAAIEPEILDLINVLQKMGAIISVDTDRTIRIEGVAKLNGYRHTALPDRIEAASWAAAALATRGDIYVRGAHQPDMTTFLNTFRKVGGAFDIDADGIRFYHPGEPLHSIALETAGHPSSWPSRRPRACRSCMRPCTRTVSVSPRRCARWARTFRSTASAWVGPPVVSARRTTTTRPSSRVRPRCTARILRSRICAVVSRT